MEGEISSCFYIFFIFGQHYFTANQIARRNFKIFWQFKLLFVAVFTMNLLNELNRLRLPFEQANDVENIDFLLQRAFGVAIVVSQVVTSVTIIVFAYSMSARQMKIFQYYQEMSKIYLHYFDHQIDYKSIKNQFFKITLLLFGIVLSIIVISMYSDIKLDKDVYHILKISFGLFFKMVAATKYIFFVNVLSSHLQTIEYLLRKTLRNLTRKATKEAHNTITDQMRSLKALFGTAFKISKQINYCFGWIIFALLVNSTLILYLSLFKVIRIINQEKSFYEANRKKFQLF